MRKELLKKALDTWGKDSQLDMVEEECAELIVAIKHRKRGKNTDEQVIEECVDVELMMEQMRLIFSSQYGTWMRIREEKLARLKTLLEV
jgi:hypothetical protein